MNTTPALIELRQVSRQFQAHAGRWHFRRAASETAAVYAVREVNLALRAGEVLGLVGESGSGKTTLARLMAGSLAPSSGERLWLGADTCTLRGAAQRDARLAVQLVHQDAQSALNPRLTVETSIGEASVVHGLIAPESRRTRVADLLAQVGLDPGLGSRYPGELSGGQRSRVIMARALAVHPQVLIADEPTASLDVSIQAQVVNLLLDLRRRHRLSLVLVSHDLALVRLLADRIAVMYQGRIVEVGGPDVLIGQAHHPYTRTLVEAAFGTHAGTAGQVEVLSAATSALGTPSEATGRLTGCSLHMRCPWAGPQCKIIEPLLREVAPGQLSACHRDSMV